MTETVPVSMAGYQPPTLRQLEPLPPDPLPTWGHVSQWATNSTSTTSATWTPSWSTVATSAVTTVTGGTWYTFGGGTAETWHSYVSARVECWAQRRLENAGWEAVHVARQVAFETREQRRIARAVSRIEAQDRAYLEEAGAVHRLDPVRMRDEIGQFRDEADKRARALLLSVLTPTQRDTFERHQCIQIVSNLGNVFTLLRKRMHGVFKHAPDGSRIEEWCVTPNGRIPLDDVLVMQKLALETDELALRRQANVWSLMGLTRGQMLHSAPEQYRVGDERPDYVRLADDVATFRTAIEDGLRAAG